MRYGTATLLALAALISAQPAAWAEERMSVERPGKAEGATRVHVAGYVLDIRQVDLADQSFEADFILALRWDDPRLANPGGPVHRVALADIWHPEPLVVNFGNLKQHMPREAEVSPEGGVVMLRRYTGTLTTRLDLTEFPFDNQTLSITFAFARMGPDDIALVQDERSKSGIMDPSIPDWEVKDWWFGAREYAPQGHRPTAGLAFDIHVGRRSSTYFISIVGVVVVIIVMSWMPFWMDVGTVNPRSSIAVTSMLTLIAYRFVAAAQLPQVAYLTRMDWFLTLSSGLVLLGLIHVVYTTHLHDSGRKDKGNEVNRRARWVAPSLFALVFVVSFLL